MGSGLDLVNRAILAGIAVSLGGAAFLFSGLAFLFPIGLYLVCYYDLNLFTGRVGYIKTFNLSVVKKLLLVLIFNLLSAYLIGAILRASGGKMDGVLGSVNAMVDSKLHGGLVPVAIRSAFCNILIILSVDSYKRLCMEKEMFAGILMLFFYCAAFVFCGFEHCVANSFYFGLAGVKSFGGFIWLLHNAMWNAFGGILCGGIVSYLNKRKEGK